jgi:protein-S-isoprenylcysteine O-methyltransferase Ste14
METSTDNPGIKIPPPFIYTGLFVLSLLMQKIRPLDVTALRTPMAIVVSILMAGAGTIFALAAIRQFLRAKTSVLPVKPASSLQTGGLYAVTRNPMYTGLLLLYTGFAFMFGNWWTLVLFPVLVYIMQTYVIRREEAYLSRRFGEPYETYRKKVPRWI